MISRFINLFKKNDRDEQAAFQAKVVEFLREIKPELNISASDDPLALNLDDKKLGLTNLRSNFLLGPQTDEELRRLVHEYFINALSSLDVEERTSLSWTDTRPNLMPQLMPVDFSEKLPLISLPFGGGIVLGFVIDSESTYSYVTKDDSVRWNITENEIYERAMDNLSERTDGLQATGTPGPNAFMVVNSLDSFDAVRIVSPDLQARFGDVIGLPFYFGIPNRDFLICWMQNGDAEFQNAMRTQISKDFDERPYPLSPLVFEMSETGKIASVPRGPKDPRAATARTN